MPKETVGLFIARAQPGLHLGQLDALQQAVDQGVTTFAIGIGSANKEFTTENPFTYEERREMILLATKGLKNIKIEIFPVPDLEDDNHWQQYIVKNAPHFDCVVTGNIRVKEIFEKIKKIVWIKIRKEVKGLYVREHLASGDTKELKTMLPQAVIRYLMDIGAPERLQNIFRSERRTPNICVDMIFHDKQGNLVLIERKHLPYGVALPGGFVRYGEDPKEAVVREIQEETGAEVSIKNLIGVYGDPNRDPRAHNISIVYEGEYLGGKIHSGDDAKKIIKVKPDIKEIKKLNFAADHQKILTDYLLRDKKIGH